MSSALWLLGGVVTVTGAAGAERNETKGGDDVGDVVAVRRIGAVRDVTERGA